MDTTQGCLISFVPNCRRSRVLPYWADEDEDQLRELLEVANGVDEFLDPVLVQAQATEIMRTVQCSPFALECCWIDPFPICFQKNLIIRKEHLFVAMKVRGPGESAAACFRQREYQ